MNGTPRILVVEADPVIRGWLDRTLRSAGFRVSLAGSLKEAAGRLSSRTGFHAIVSEYTMPDGTCPELLAAFRDEQGRTLPALVTSSETSAAADTTPDCHFLARPFDGAQLLSALDRLLGPSGLS